MGPTEDPDSLAMLLHTPLLLGDSQKPILIYSTRSQRAANGFTITPSQDDCGRTLYTCSTLYMLDLGL